MKFYINNKNLWAIKTDDHLEVSFYHERGEIAEFYIDDCDFTPTNDTLTGIYVVIERELKSISTLLIDAALFIEDLIEEENKTVYYMGEPCKVGGRKNG